MGEVCSAIINTGYWKGYDDGIDETNEMYWRTVANRKIATLLPAMVYKYLSHRTR
jgi:hypothetical protein